MPPSAAALKYTSLALMLIQNSSFVLVMRYSRQQQKGAKATQYNVAMVIVFQECFKVVVCLLMQAHALGSVIGPARLLLNDRRGILRIAVPAVCFTLQNNVLYLALSNLDPFVFQVTYQVKTLLTAVMSVQMLGKSLARVQWLSQLLLTAGIVLVQLGDQAQASKPAGGTSPPAPPTFGRHHGSGGGDDQHLLLGLSAVLVAALSSSYASVYFERVLKAPRCTRSPAPSANPPRPSSGLPAFSSAPRLPPAEPCARGAMRPRSHAPAEPCGPDSAVRSPHDARPRPPLLARSHACPDARTNSA